MSLNVNNISLSSNTAIGTNSNAKIHESASEPTQNKTAEVSSEETSSSPGVTEDSVSLSPSAKKELTPEEETPKDNDGPLTNLGSGILGIFSQLNSREDIIINGTDKNDKWTVSQNRQGDVIVNLNGKETVYPQEDANFLKFKLGEGDNSFIADDSVKIGLDVNAGDGNNTIVTGKGNDSITVGNGDNNIEGGKGNDTILAGDGNNTVYGDNNPGALNKLKYHLDLFSSEETEESVQNDAKDQLLGFSLADSDIITLGNGSNLVYGGDGNDSITVGNGGNTIYGEKGSDTIYAGDGNDRIYGGDGNDKIYGKGGNDIIYGGKGKDHLDGGAGDDIIYGQSGNDVIYGLDGDDKLYGGDGDDYIDGGKGNDLILGGSGDDILAGGLGKDTVISGFGNDVIIDDKKDISFIESLSGTKIHEISSDPDIASLGSNFKIEGDENFKMKAASDLEVIKATPSGLKTLREIENTGKNITIQQERDNLNNAYASSEDIEDVYVQPDGTPGKGGDVTIGYNGSFSLQGQSASEDDVPPSVVLFHELTHAYNMASGTMLNFDINLKNEYGSYPVNACEHQAVGLPIPETDRAHSNRSADDDLKIESIRHPDGTNSLSNPEGITENDFRRELNLSERTKY